MHVLVLARGWWDLDALHKTWREIWLRMGCDVRHRPNVDVADKGALKEVLKYVTKHWELDGYGLLVVMGALWNKRLIQGFGGVRVTDDGGVEVVCPGCGAPYDGVTFNWRDVTEEEMRQEVLSGVYWADYWEVVENRLVLRRSWGRKVDKTFMSA